MCVRAGGGGGDRNLVVNTQAFFNLAVVVVTWVVPDTFASDEVEVVQIAARAVLAVVVFFGLKNKNFDENADFRFFSTLLFVVFRFQCC